MGAPMEQDYDSLHSRGRARERGKDSPLHQVGSDDVVNVVEHAQLRYSHLPTLQLLDNSVYYTYTQELLNIHMHIQEFINHAVTRSYRRIDGGTERLSLLITVVALQRWVGMN